MEHTFKTKGTCAKQIVFSVDENYIVGDVSFHGGCAGNALGLASLAEGAKAEDLIKRLRGIKCGFKSTSCPDQFALALEEVLAKK